MDNTALNGIKERLLKDNDTRRRYEIESANASANGYVRGVEDTLVAVSFARPEQPRTNLDRIRAMSAEEIAEFVMHTMKCKNCPLCGKDGRCEKDAVYDTSECTAALVKWLNSPTKEDGNA